MAEPWFKNPSVAFWKNVTINLSLVEITLSPFVQRFNQLKFVSILSVGLRHEPSVSLRWRCNTERSTRNFPQLVENSVIWRTSLQGFRVVLDLCEGRSCAYLLYVNLLLIRYIDNGAFRSATHPTPSPSRSLDKGQTDDRSLYQSQNWLCV